MEQAIAKARKLPMEVVDLRSVKIGGEVYELDRSIKIPSSSAKDGETEAQSRPAKKAKTEEREYYLEIKWENSDYDAEHNWVTKKYSMFSDEIPDEDDGGVEMSRAFQGAEKNHEGENHQCYFTLCLVDAKSENRNKLVEIEVYYWTVPINLMHFNILSQDLANFCRDLWNAAGRNENDYCDMAIEFGESRYSREEISELIEEATGIFRKHVMYIEKAKLMQGASSRDSMRLLQMIYDTFPASVISYEVDLKSMGIMKDQCAAFGFQQLRYYKCFVGPTDEI